jgi:transposase
MGHGYSLDLREKLVGAWLRRGLNVQELSELFGVGSATVKRWQRLYRETGRVDPRPHGGGRPRAIADDQLPIVEKLVKAHPDWTDDEYTAYLKKEHGFTASRSAVGRTIRRLGYSVKKRPSPLRRKIVQRFEQDESSTSETSATSPLHVWFSWTKQARTSR